MLAEQGSESSALIQQLERAELLRPVLLNNPILNGLNLDLLDRSDHLWHAINNETSYWVIDEGDDRLFGSNHHLRVLEMLDWDTQVFGSSLRVDVFHHNAGDVKGKVLIECCTSIQSFFGQVFIVVEFGVELNQQFLSSLELGVRESFLYVGGESVCDATGKASSSKVCGIGGVVSPVQCLSAEGEHGGYVEVVVNAERGDLPAKAEESVLFILEYVSI